MQFLETTNVEACMGYLKHVTDALDEKSPELHDKLAELYLGAARKELKAGEGECEGELIERGTQSMLMDKAKYQRHMARS